MYRNRMKPEIYELVVQQIEAGDAVPDLIQRMVDEAHDQYITIVSQRQDNSATLEERAWIERAYWKAAFDRFHTKPAVERFWLEVGDVRPARIQ